ncbi:hypothetical protein SteCoe_23996 [Stentor coeruleus]|uniref:Uncharacterized protein n=1 Tax=Stentor coeruleus TaxID=5963 RepID=A0A1R2BIL3_9CILI|nr:hypothetical protein SteCoe_23996 [Stentor coeruleus]
MMKSDLLKLKEELAALKSLENDCTISKMQEENFILKTQADKLKNEFLSVKEVNEGLKKSIAMKEEILAQIACKKIGKDYESNKNYVEEGKNEEEIGDQVSKLGERLNDIMRRYTAMPK